LTPGRFVFCPPGTPFYPGGHWYFNGDWISDDELGPEPLGEVRGLTRQWDRGEAPNPYPATTAIGSPQCFASGEEATFPTPGPCGMKGCTLTYGDSNLQGIADLEMRLREGSWVGHGFTDTGNYRLDFEVLIPESKVLADLIVKVSYQGNSSQAGMVVPRTCSDGPPYFMTFLMPTPAGLPPAPGDAFVNLRLDPGHSCPYNDREYQAGFPADCYAPLSPFHPDDFIRLDVGYASDQLFFAELQQRQYDTPLTAESWLRTKLGAAAAVSQVDNSASLYPGSIIGTSNRYTVVSISGTTNPQQLATQGLYAATPQISVGTFKTLALWYAAKNRIALRLTTHGDDPTRPIILVGHSYGGVVAFLLACDLKAAAPNRRVSLLTYGMPKPGDAACGARAEGIERRHLANRGDPVPCVPFSFPFWIGVKTGFPPLLTNQWDGFTDVGGRTILEADGTRIDDDSLSCSFGDVGDIIASAIAAVGLPTYMPHGIAEYILRLSVGQGET